MLIESVAISSLFEDPSNVRTHNQKNLDAIKGSLTKFGQQTPIVVGVNNIVLAGNGRLRAARELGWETINIVRSELKGVDATGFALADNRTGELAEWDPGLGDVLKALQVDDFDLNSIGWSDEDLSSLLGPGDQDGQHGATDPDDVPKNVETRCKPGDVWILDNHRLMCGDSTNVQHVEQLIGGEKIDLCFTSPPYTDQRKYNGDKELSTEHLATFMRASYGLVGLFAVNLGLSRKDGEVQCYWDAYIREAKECGLKLLSWNVWDRSYAASIGQQTAMFAIEHEWIFVFGAERQTLNLTVQNKNANQKMGGRTSNRESDDRMTGRRNEIVHEKRRLGTIIRQDIHRGESPHPAMFPVALPEAYIEACTDRGDNVYEPFAGSGTTIIACEQTGRRCFGMEIDPKYCDIIIKRWEDFAQKAAVLETPADV